MKSSIKDTIAAIGTRLGESAIGIIKLSGMDSIKIADKIFEAKNSESLRYNHQCRYKFFYKLIPRYICRILEYWFIISKSILFLTIAI